MYDLRNFLEMLHSLKLTPKSSTKIRIDKALNRILSSDVVCEYDIPRFDNSAMDGYAIKLGYDCYEIIDSIFAGSNANIAINNNQAAKIMTGAKIPQGTEAVVQKELTSLSQNKLYIQTKPSFWQCIKLKGEDYKKGEILLKKGSKIDSQSIGILASQGIDSVSVAKKVKIIIFGSGNEIASIGTRLKENHIYDINSYFIRAVLSSLNCKITYGGILGDDALLIAKTLHKASQKYDIIITSGGVSVGDKDYIHNVLERINAEILADSINIKPGKPVVLSRLEDSFILCLPGNPIGAFFHCVFTIPTLIQKYSSSAMQYLKGISLINKEDFSVTPNTSHIILGNIDDGHFSAFNNAKYQGAQIAPLFKSNAIAIFENKNFVKKNSIIKIVPYKMEFADYIDTMCNILN